MIQGREWICDLVTADMRCSMCHSGTRKWMEKNVTKEVTVLTEERQYF
jgi:hypothetical protein